jgi:hypothetical protein
MTSSTRIAVRTGCAFVAALAVTALGCSTASSSGATPAADAAPAGPPNPYGVPYPTDSIGSSPRKGPIKGSRIADYTFQGYPNGDVSKGLKTIALADYYDPQGKLGHKILHLGVSAAWCVPCNEETDAIVPLVMSLGAQGVVFAEALGEGTTQGTGATQVDLTMWIAKHKTNFTQMLDPEYQNLGMFFDPSALPWNAIIDTRSMEILQAGTGYSGSIPNDLSPWITWVGQNLSSYP